MGCTKWTDVQKDRFLCKVGGFVWSLYKNTSI